MFLNEQGAACSQGFLEVRPSECCVINLRGIFPRGGAYGLKAVDMAFYYKDMKQVVFLEMTITHCIFIPSGLPP